MTTEEQPTYDTLPTGKQHVSFSEVKVWHECSYRHHLAHVKKLGHDEPSPILEFGTAIHAACEHFLRTKELKSQVAVDHIKAAWDKNKDIPGFDDAGLAKAILDAVAIMNEVPQFMDDNFPEWSTIDAEHALYESIDGHNNAFKGFIDGVVRSKGKRGQDLYWIIDWKTSVRGWRREQRQDETKKYQLALYKNFWCKKHPDIDPANVRCAFLILTRAAKPGKHCEAFIVSLGEVPIKRSLKVVNNMLTSVKKGLALKNRNACMWCEFKNTEHCT